MTARAGRPVAFSQMSEFTDLFFPDPVSSHGLVSWLKGTTLLWRQPEQRLHALLKRYKREAGEHPHLPVVRVQLDKELEDSSHIANWILLFAIPALRLKTFVFQIHGNHAYELVPEVWTGAAMPAANPVAMAKTGRFSLVTDLLPQCHIVQVAGQPLFLRKRDFASIWRRYAGDQGERLSFGEKVIEKFFLEHSSSVFMPKDEYKAALWEEFPGATAIALEKERLTLRPEWKGHIGGRPKR